MSLQFTRAWEDDRLDAELLAVERGERVLVVAAAGDSALALAARGAQVTAVDLSFDQLALTALKVAASVALAADEAHRWFEIGRVSEARTVYDARLRPLLAAVHAAYWDANIELFGRGIHDAAGVGRPFARIGRVVRFILPSLARTVATTPDPAAQAAWWRHWARPVLFGPLTHALAARTRVLAPLAPHPEELARMRAGGWTRALVGRIDAIVAASLVREHPWWRPICEGRAAGPGNGARWLDADALAVLAAGSSVTLTQSDLAAALRAVPPGLAAVSLSNVPDWLAEAAIADLAEAAAVALAPGGRVLVRRVVAPARPDPFELAGLIRDPISGELPRRDRTALYEAVDLYMKPHKRA